MARAEQDNLINVQISRRALFKGLGALSVASLLAAFAYDQGQKSQDTTQAPKLENPSFAEYFESPDGSLRFAVPDRWTYSDDPNPNSHEFDGPGKTDAIVFPSPDGNVGSEYPSEIKVNDKGRVFIIRKSDTSYGELSIWGITRSLDKFYVIQVIGPSAESEEIQQAFDRFFEEFELLR